ncbi:hypothetical protein BDW71DRAFT_171839, partial [Aspergillus fruticulosus]
MLGVNERSAWIRASLHQNASFLSFFFFCVFAYATHTGLFNLSLPLTIIISGHRKTCLATHGCPEHKRI